VRDEEVGEVEVLLEPFEKVQDLRLDRDVERRHGLVADDELRGEGERSGDPDPLALAPGELVRVPVVVLGVQAGPVHELPDSALRVPLCLVNREGRPDDLANGLTRVERRIGILEHHLHLTAVRAHVSLRELGDVGALEHDRAGRGVEELHDEAGGGRLPAARLPHEPERLAGIDVERDVVDGLHPAHLALEDDPARNREVLLQVANRDEGALGGRRLGPGGRGRRDAHWPLLGL
jgi:hypothetical protein